MNLKSIQNETKIRSGLDNSGCDTIFAVTVLLLRVEINQQKRTWHISTSIWHLQSWTGMMRATRLWWRGVRNGRAMG